MILGPNKYLDGHTDEFKNVGWQVYRQWVLQENKAFPTRTKKNHESCSICLKLMFDHLLYVYLKIYIKNSLFS